MTNRRLRVTPQAGPPGRSVRLEGEGLPPSAEVVIGFGAPRGNHELLESVVTDSRGSLSLELPIPTWAEPDLAHYFFLNLPDQPPLATSPAFHVVRRDGTLSVTGQVDGPLEAGGVALLGDFRDLYCIQGAGSDFQGLPEGTRVTLTGRVGDGQLCSEGVPVRLEAFRLR